MLEAIGLAKRFGGVEAVVDVSLHVAAGEVLALIGPNGAGKTTLFNLLAGQVTPDRGRVHLAGQDVTGWTPRALAHHGLARSFQIPDVFRSMTVRENLQVALASHADRLWRFWSPLATTAVAEADCLLATAELGHLADQAAGVLAYGDVKRLELALALVGEPRVVLLDEPTAGTAPAERAGLMRTAIAAARARDAALLFTEHDMDVVFEHADRVAVLDAGRIIASGTPEAIRADPVVQRAYLGHG